MRNFQILIVSIGKICKQCMQTASATGGSSQIPYRGFATGSYRNFRSPDPWTIVPYKLLASSLSCAWAALGELPCGMRSAGKMGVGAVRVQAEKSGLVIG